MIPPRNRFAYAKAHVLYTAPFAIAFVAIWLGFLGLLTQGLTAPDGGDVIVGLFGGIGGFFLSRISVRNFRQSLNDYRITKARRQK